MKLHETSITRRRGWSIAEAANIYGVSRGFLLNRIKQGALPARKRGRRVIILDADLVLFFESERDR
jgi:excisionase family DNA binding protein